MALVHAVSLLHQAQRHGYAIGAFNFNTVEQAQAVVTAAELERSPVILQISHRALNYLGSGTPLRGLRYAAALGRVAAENVPVPVVLHLDHGTREEVIAAVAAGFTSVMFDGGDLDVEDNIAQTRMIKAWCQNMNVSLEAELGETPKPGGSASEEYGALTDPADVPMFVERTGVDALAISVGSAHGGLEKGTHLDLARIDAIHRASSVPLVLHGSSGVTDEDIRQAIQLGVCKVNTATLLNQAFTDAVRSYLAGAPDAVDPRSYLAPAREVVVTLVRERLRLLGGSGMA